MYDINSENAIREQEMYLGINPFTKKPIQPGGLERKAEQKQPLFSVSIDFRTDEVKYTLCK